MLDAQNSSINYCTIVAPVIISSLGKTGHVTAQNVLPENCPADRLWQPNLVRDQIWLPYLVLTDRMWLPCSVPPCHIMSARGPNVASIFCPVGPYMAAIFGPGPNVAATFGPGPNVSN